MFLACAACALAALAAAGCGGDDGGGGEAPKAKSAKERGQTLERLDAAQVATRVEKLRQLEYGAIPKLRVVTKEQSARHTMEQAGSAANVKVDEEVAKLLGVFPPDLDVEEIAGSLGAEALLGYYEDKPARVALVVGPAADDPKTAEAVLAHELLHGLQDQRFGIFSTTKRLNRGSGDRESAYAALVEGDAKVLERSYAEKYGASPDFGGGDDAEQAVKAVPFAVLLQVSFTYEKE